MSFQQPYGASMDVFSQVTTSTSVRQLRVIAYKRLCILELIASHYVASHAALLTHVFTAVIRYVCF